MTETTAVQQLILKRHVYAPPVADRPAVTTFMAQGAVGYIAGNFVVILPSLFLFPDDNNVLAVILVPLLLVLGGLIGVPAGAVIWAAWKHATRPLNWFYGAVIGIAVIDFFWLLFVVFLDWPPDPLMLVTSLAPGIGIGLISGSRLRPGRELVRVSDPVGPVLRVFAGFSGFVLRLTVTLLFMVSCITLICILQSSYYQRIDRIWSIVAFTHFTAALVLLSARIRIDMLLPLAVIVNVPVVALLFRPPQPDELLPLGSISYLGLWATFLLTNWRQTQTAVSVLEEEFRYYLID